MMLLQPFSAPIVAPEHAGALAGLGARYGPGWVSELLAAWNGRGLRWMYNQAALIGTAIVHAGDVRDPALANLPVTTCWPSTDPTRHRGRR